MTADLSQGAVLERLAAASAAQAGGENFPVALRVLPRDPRDKLMRAYAFARFVDDVGDEAPGDRIALLDVIDADVRAAPSGAAALPVVRALRPLVGDGSGVWSFCHLEDAAAATVAAVDQGAPGIYNVCDDEPVEIRTWLPEYARAVGAPPPRHVPTWLGRLLAGEVVVSMMTQIRGASNAKAKAALDWKPQYPSYREGFDAGLG
jgi:Squalene/phytoene synthase